MIITHTLHNESIMIPTISVSGSMLIASSSLSAIMPHSFCTASGPVEIKDGISQTRMEKKKGNLKERRDIDMAIVPLDLTHSRR